MHEERAGWSMGDSFDSSYLRQALMRRWRMSSPNVKRTLVSRWHVSSEGSHVTKALDG